MIDWLIGGNWSNSLVLMQKLFPCISQMYQTWRFFVFHNHERWLSHADTIKAWIYHIRFGLRTWVIHSWSSLHTMLFPKKDLIDSFVLFIIHQIWSFSSHKVKHCLLKIYLVWDENFLCLAPNCKWRIHPFGDNRLDVQKSFTCASGAHVNLFASKDENLSLNSQLRKIHQSAFG